jgi:hypothetical protein
VFDEAEVMMLLVVIGHASTKSMCHGTTFVVQHVCDIHDLGRR